MKYYIGLDNGGTTTKAALYDKEGREICVASMATKMLEPAPGFVERDMEEMWNANCFVVRNVLKKSGIDPTDVAGVAVCGHGKGLYLWGKNGKPVRNGIISTDNRAWEYSLGWIEDGTDAKASERTCQQIISCQPAALLAWLRDHEPECLDKIEWVFEAKDYVRFRLTGEAKAELGDYSGTNLINLHTQEYDEELLKFFDLEQYKEALPPLCRAAEICGYVTEEASKETGLVKGTPVAGGMFDVHSCMLAANALTEEKICMIAGTWSVNLYLSKKPVIDKEILKHSRNTIFVLPGYYLVEEGSPTSAGNNEWFIQNLLPELVQEYEGKEGSVYEEINRWVDEIPAEEFCPIFLPFLTGSNAHPNAKGSFVGMSSYHTRKHVFRSVYEGVAFSHRMHLERLMKSYQGKPKVIRLTGGVAKSKVWTQMFADVMNLPIEVLDADETGALGCAIAAAAAVGDFPSVEAASEQMCRISKRIMPNQKNIGTYNQKYALYCKTIDSLHEVWDSYQKYMDRNVNDGKGGIE